MDFATSTAKGGPDPSDPLAPLRGELARIRLVGIALNLAEDVLVDRAATFIGCDEKPVDGEVELANTEHHLDVVGIQNGKVCARVLCQPLSEFVRAHAGDGTARNLRVAGGFPTLADWSARGHQGNWSAAKQ